ncbi:hypothetical protein ABC502_03045 [Alkalimonas sp. NCh-2]|uniref:hypothetical protein n=1 Tax=Alkalimonas sp. NCh-2 TaxID=3144846 RepID=UPI0031F61859
MKRLFVTMMLVFFSALANAECSALQCAGVTNTFLQSLKTTATDVQLGFPAGVNAALDCELYAGRYAKMAANSMLFKSQHAIVLTAIASNTPLMIRFEPSETYCIVSEVEILVVE